KEIFMNFIKMTRQVESYRHLGENRIVIRRTKSGGAGCYLTVAVRENKKYVTTEINYESKEIRLKLTDSESEGVRLSFGTFTLPIKFCNDILSKDTKRICLVLEKKNDGWWYCKY
ncbi:TPA: hypothetical protein ACHYX3_004985, partial [Escherichia coli]